MHPRNYETAEFIYNPLHYFSFDAVKMQLLARLENRPARLDLTIYPYRPRPSGQPIHAPISGLSPIRPLRLSQQEPSGPIAAGTYVPPPLKICGCNPFIVELDREQCGFLPMFVTFSLS